MEDVLDVYHRPRDPNRPMVCLDETSKQLISETRVPIPAQPGRPARHDYEYARNGTANLFMLFAPLEGWRHVKVTDRHAALDYAEVLKELSDILSPSSSGPHNGVHFSRRLWPTQPHPKNRILRRKVARAKQMYIYPDSPSIRKPPLRNGAKRILPIG
jgi:hypothetical protein